MIPEKQEYVVKKGVTLLTVDFDEPLTEIHIRERLKEKSLI